MMAPPTRPSTSPARPSSASLPATAYDVFVAGQLLDADRSARMKFIGTDADFRAHSEFAAVGELCGGVMQHDRAVDPVEEAFGGCGIGGHDRIRVARAVMLDVRDCRVDAVDDAYGNDGVEIFGVPILFGRRLDARIGLPRRLVAADFTAGI